MQNLNTQVQVSHMKIINKIIQVNKCIRKNSQLNYKEKEQDTNPTVEC